MTLRLALKKLALGLWNPGLRRQVAEADLVMHDEHLAGRDARNAGYNLGDLLNMPWLTGLWARTPHNSAHHLERMIQIASMSPSSILSIYCRDRPADEPVPSIARLRAAVMEYSGMRPYAPSAAMRRILRDPRCLCVHLRAGDTDLDAGLVFRTSVVKLSKDFDRVVLLTGLHLDQQYRSHEDKKKALLQEVNALLQACPNAYLYLDHPDAHLCAMQLASNLLVHRGGFSALGAIVATGRVHATDTFEYGWHAHWHEEVGGPIPRIVL